MPEPHQFASSSSQSRTIEWRLEGTLGLAEAESVRVQALELAGGDGDVVADLSAVPHLGGGCAQVLLALSRALGAGGRRFELRGASPEVGALLETTGFAVALSAPRHATTAE